MLKQPLELFLEQIRQRVIELGAKPSATTRLMTRFRRNPGQKCWEHVVTLGGSGYPQITINFRPYLLTRLSLELKLGRQLEPGECALHKCDNRACINPDHLFVGTKADNCHDRHAKGRTCIGVNQPRRKLWPQQIQAILASSEGSRPLAKKYGVCPTLIKNIRNRRTWKHVNPRKEE